MAVESQSSFQLSSISSKSNEDVEPSEWILNTVPWTTVKACWCFFKTLPDRGTGQQVVYKALSYQVYIDRMTREEAEIVNRIPIVDMIVAGGSIKVLSSRMANDTSEAAANSLQRKFIQLTMLSHFPCEKHQKIMSYPQYRDIRTLPDTDLLYGYSFEATARDDAFVYFLEG